MNPMTQEPDPAAEVVVLKERSPFPGTSGYTFAQRAYNGDGWFAIGNDLWARDLSQFGHFEGWWPLDYRSVVDQ